MPNYVIYSRETNAHNVGVAVSSTNTYYSKTFAARDGRAVSFHLEWAGTPAGTFTLWYSNKPNADEADDDDWVRDTTWTPTNPAGSASKGFYTVGNVTAERVRLKYVNASGSGTILGWAQIAVNG